MPISFKCPHCGAESVVADQFAGQAGPCKSCGQSITVPGAASAAAPAPAFPPPPTYGGKKSNVWLWVVLGVVGVCCCTGILPALLLPAVQAAREAARSTTCRNNMREITLAMLQYEAKHGTLPPAYVADENGKPLHSWRVLILPFLDQKNLYDQYDLNEPWDGPNNSRLAELMPSVYRCPSTPPGSPPAPLTSYAVVTGPGLIFDGTSTTTLASIAAGDGAASTILLVESYGAQINWMEPRDLDFGQMSHRVNDAAGGSPACVHPKGMNVSFVDGHVRFVRDSISSEILKALLTPRGGELVGDNL